MEQCSKDQSEIDALLALRSHVTAAAFRWAIEGGVTGRYLARLDRLGCLTSEEVDAWQHERLAKFQKRLRHRVTAYGGPAYEVDGLSKLPLIQKDDVRRNPESYRDRWVPARRVTTGGTSGKPLAVDVAVASFFTEWAHVAYAWRTGGVTPIDCKISFRGSALGQGYSQGPLRFDRVYNQMSVSPFHLNDTTFRKLIDEVRDLRPVALWGYPSAITPFANWVARTGPYRELAAIRAVLLASEGSFDWQVKLFQNVFDATVVRWYGQTEKVIFASGCQFGGGYHVLPTYGIAEVLEGHLIGSGFTNRAMPLLRYDTEDTALLGPSCRCGSPFPWLQTVDGRWDQALLWGSSGEPISTTALNFHDKLFGEFDRFQFRQEEAGRATLLLARSAENVDWPDIAEAARRLLQERVGDKLLIEVLQCDPAEMLTQRGKVLAVDQRYAPPATWTSSG